MEPHRTFFADPRTWVAVAFVIFFVIFGRKLWQGLTSTLDRRADTVRLELFEAARLRREAEAMLADASKRRDEALAEAATIITRARDEASRLAAAAATEATASAGRRERMALDRIAAAEKAAVTEVRQAAVEVASAASVAVIRSDFGAEADAELVDHAILGLPTALARRAA